MIMSCAAIKVLAATKPVDFRKLVGRIMIRRYGSPRWRVTPEPVIGPRFARTRWAPTRPTG